MTDKVAFLSDIHGNVPALQAILDAIAREHCTTVFMLGDIINGIDPHGCIQLLRSWSDTNQIALAGIKGNAEAYVVTPDREVLRQQSDVWDVDLLNLLQWWHDHLSESDRAWIHALPDTLSWRDALLVHDSPMDRLAVHLQTDILPHYRELAYHGRGITPDMTPADWQQLEACMVSERVTQVFCGHTHRPFYQAIGERLVCNVGSAGMPLDGDPRPSWVVAEYDGVGIPSIAIRRETYDIGAMLQRMNDTPDYGMCQ
jgi:predicted phosphodiesterase